MADTTSQTSVTAQTAQTAPATCKIYKFEPSNPNLVEITDEFNALKTMKAELESRGDVEKQTHVVAELETTYAALESANTKLESLKKTLQTERDMFADIQQAHAADQNKLKVNERELELTKSVLASIQAQLEAARKKKQAKLSAKCIPYIRNVLGDIGRAQIVMEKDSPTTRIVTPENVTLDFPEIDPVVLQQLVKEYNAHYPTTPEGWVARTMKVLEAQRRDCFDPHPVDEFGKSLVVCRDGPLVIEITHVDLIDIEAVMTAYRA